MDVVLYVSNNFKQQRVPSLLLGLNLAKYLINAPESTQRFLKENGMKVGADLRLLLTGSSPDHYAGLVGLTLTAASRETVDNRRIYCPLRAFERLMAYKYPAGLHFLNCGYYGFAREKSRDQKLLGFNESARNVFFPAARSRPLEFDDWPKEAQGKAQGLIDPADRLADSSRFLPDELLRKYNGRVIDDGHTEIIAFSLAEAEKIESSVSYLFIFKEKSLRMRKKIIEELKLSSKEISELVEKKTLALEDGRILAWDDLCFEEQPFAVLVLEVPDRASAERLAENELLKWLFAREVPELDLRFVFHLSNAEIVLEKNFVEWLELPSISKTKHVFLHSNFIAEFNQNEEPENLSELRYRALFQICSRRLPFIFPRKSSAPFNFLSRLQQVNCQKEIFGSFHRINIKNPRVEKIQFSEKNQEILADIGQIYKPEELEDPLYKIYLPKLTASPSFKNFPFFVTLGTGSMLAQTFRNVSGTLFALAENFYGLFDCGEGTLFQLAEQFGDDLGLVLAKIRLVLVSHVHGDHLHGVVPLLQRRAEALRALPKAAAKNPLFICCPLNCLPTLLDFIESSQEELFVAVLSPADLARLFRPEDRFLFARKGLFEQARWSPDGFSPSQPEAKCEENKAALGRLFPERAEQLAAALKSAGVESLLAVPVWHCPESCGFVLDFQGKRVVYSGDCRPTEQLAVYGRGADLLFHEATFDCAENTAVVLRRNHSSICDAVKMAVKMQAKFACLTHFSQKFVVDIGLGKKQEVRVPGLGIWGKYFEERVFLAQDHLHFELETLPMMARLKQLVNPWFVFNRSPVEKSSIKIAKIVK